MRLIGRSCDIVTPHAGGRQHPCIPMTRTAGTLSRPDQTSPCGAVGGKNVALMDELGLTEFLGHYDTIVGPPDEVGATMKELEALGVDIFFAGMPGHADREGALRRLSRATGRT